MTKSTAPETIEKIASAISDVIEDSPVPNYEENDYNAGYREGLLYAIDVINYVRREVG
ncbi:MAG: hypothetical protein LBC38_01125 [Oscillospiraceae bacterium]|jgi:hypothetical protein|nr:hypothetical protein [Oscillospiraceae bacterium]